MAVLSLPLRDDYESLSYTLTLDGVDYVLAFEWCARAGLWHLDMSAADGTPLLQGRPLVVDWPLLWQVHGNPALPAGELVAEDMQGLGVNPGRVGLGTRWRVLYYERATLDALGLPVGA